MEKLPISLVIIAKNEEHNLPRCLNAVSSWVSEIIAVINNCEDNTRAVLESYNAKVYEYDWQGSTTQKNRAIEHASQPWILSLDADEVLSDTLSHSIKQFIKNPSSYSGAHFPRRTWFMGRWITHGDWYPDYMLRVFRNGKGTFTGGKDHEIVKLDGISKKLKGDLLHYSFDNITHLLSKYPRFGDAFLKTQLEKGKKFSSLEVLGRAAWRFFRCYFLRKGFLDGYPGFYIAFNQAYYTLFRYTRLLEHQISTKEAKI